MKSLDPHAIAEERQSLWLLVWPPTIWAAHFLASYALAVVWCRGISQGLPREEATGMQSGHWLGLAITGLALVAIVAISAVGWRGWHRLRDSAHPIEDEEAGDEDSSEDRHRFLGFATVLLAALSVIATVYVSAAALIGGSCG